MAEKYEHRGSCSCGWRGPWRPASSDAHEDVDKHCAEAVGEHSPISPWPDDDLMPHER